MKSGRSNCLELISVNSWVKLSLSLIFDHQPSLRLRSCTPAPLGDSITWRTHGVMGRGITWPCRASAGASTWARPPPPRPMPTISQAPRSSSMTRTAPMGRPAPGALSMLDWACQCTPLGARSSTEHQGLIRGKEQLLPESNTINNLMLSQLHSLFQ